MKKKVLKELEQVARQLPPMQESRSIRIVPGQSLIDAGRTEVNGVPVNPKHRYRLLGEPPKMRTPVNHFTRLKEAHKRGGDEEVKRYIKSVFANEENIKKTLLPQA